VPERTSCVHALLLDVFMRHLARLVSETTKYKLRQITVLKWLSGWVHYPDSAGKAFCQDSSKDRYVTKNAKKTNGYAALACHETEIAIKSNR